MSLYDYTGVIHLHSAFSFDGHVGLDNIIAAAADNNIDFLMLTDHDHLRARDEGWEGWNGKVLLIVGQEISPRFNHYLAFNIATPIHCPEDMESIHPQKYIDEVNNQGGFGLIAHPDHEGTKKFHVKHYPWNDWTVDGYAGISIWDFMTDWQSSLNSYLPSFFSYFFPAIFLRGPRQITLNRWDFLNQKLKIIGIGELDNHATMQKVLGLEFEALPFNRAFKFIRTHIVTKQPLYNDSKKDIALLLESLRYGRCYAAMEYFEKSAGFDFCITQNDRSYFMGDSLSLTNDSYLKVTLPLPALIRIIKNGTVWAQEKKISWSLQLKESGIYRVEVYLKACGKYRPWIFSNHIFVN
jgi:hypothetical protein